MTRPGELTVADLVRALERRELSPVDAVTDAIEHIHATEPEIGAWAFLDEEGALAAARRLESERPAASRLPLYGVPVGVKDVIDVRGMPTGARFEPFRTRIPREDSGAVEAVRQAGAIIIGKTVTVQFAWGQDAPPTRNPWDLRRSPGGSSTGSGAAVAARQVPLALGTQTTGSLLRPAAYCGAVGLKPSYGRVSNFGVLPTSWSSDHVGVITRSVADAALWLQSSARHDPRDPVSVACAEEDFGGLVRELGRAPRLGLVRDLVDRCEPEVRSGIAGAVERFARAGGVIVELRLPVTLERLLASHWLILASEGASIHAELHANHAEHYLPRTRSNVEVAALIPAAVYGQALRLRRAYRPVIGRMFDGLDALLAPCAPQNAPIPGDDPAHPLGDPNFLAIWTSFGLPALSLPTGLDPRGLPTAVQIVAPRFADRTLLGVAGWCERVIGALPNPPQLGSAATAR